jgi:hypothetical protein
LLRSRKLKRQLAEAKKRVGRHETLKTTPAVAAGVELKAWRLEDVVEMPAKYMRGKEDAKFETAFAAL